MVTLGVGWSVLPEAVGSAGPEPLIPSGEGPIAERSLVAAQRADAPAEPLVEDFLTLAREI